VTCSNFSAADPPVYSSAVHKSKITVIRCTGHLLSRRWVQSRYDLRLASHMPYNFDLCCHTPTRNCPQTHFSQTRAGTHTSNHKKTKVINKPKCAFVGKTLGFTPKVYVQPSELSVTLKLLFFMCIRDVYYNSVSDICYCLY